MTFAILPYKLGNTYSKDVANALGGFRINPKANTYYRKRDHRLINWGCSQTHYARIFQPGDFNHPETVRNGTQKLRAFRIWKDAGVSCPEFTNERSIAQEWNARSVVYGRDTEMGARGEGITVYQPGSEVGRHLFYTKGVRILREYRIHAGRGLIIDVTQKLRRNGHADANPLVRTAENGWVFCRNNIVIPSGQTMLLAIKAVEALGLDFAGVDICEDYTGAGVVFEVNTAPAIEGTTIKHYKEFFEGQANV